MNGFFASLRHELLCTARARVPQLLLVVFLGMVSVSSFIGWSARSTVTAVYTQITSAGLTTAPNPFAGTFTLILSRPIGTVGRLLGQLSALSVVIAVVIGISTIISWASISVITGGILGLDPTLRLAAFAGLSWLLLTAFALLGMFTGTYSKKETTALLAPFVAWSIIAFVLPQLGTAARPVALLNPVPSIPPPGGGIFDIINVFTGPLAVTEQFKRAAGIVLQDSAITGSPTTAIIVLIVFLAVMAVLVAVTPRRRLRSPLND
jgi:ABC-2 type transport system permease protein